MSFMQSTIAVLSALFLIEAGAPVFGAENDCGRIIRHSKINATIFTLCPTLPDLDATQLAKTIELVIENAGGIRDDTTIYFVSDETIVEPRSGWPQDLGRRIETWGPKFVGWHKHQSGNITIRDNSSGGWRTVALPFPQVPSNNALHLQTAPVTLLASARTAPYASFKLA